MGISFSGALPNSIDKLRTTLFMILGALLGWLRSPTVWLVAGPLRTIALLLGSTAQESGYNSAVSCGDEGASCGVLQFKQSTIEALGGTNEDRSSPFWSAYFGVRMIAKALSEGSGWWALAIPGYGFAVKRYLWTHGWGAPSPMTYAWAKMGPNGTLGEPRAWGAFIFWRAVGLVIIVIAVMSYRKMKK